MIPTLMRTATGNSNWTTLQDRYRNIGYWVQQKEDMTQVPKSNVFDDLPDIETE